MNAKTPELSTSTESRTTEYTSEERADIARDFYENRQIARQTITAVVPEKNEGTLDKAATSAAMKEAYLKTQKILNNITPRTNVPFINQQPNGYGAGGDYSSTQNIIRTKIENLSEGSLVNQSQLSIEQIGILAHEHHHQYYAHTKIETRFHGTTLASEAPMDLEQKYKLEQADEIGSNIASCIALRQVYIENKLACNQAKQELIEVITSNKQYKQLKEVITNEQDVKIEESNIKFKDKKGKEVHLSMKEMDQQTSELLLSYINHKNRVNDVLSIADKDKNGKYKYPMLGDVMGEYFAKVKEGNINPLDSKNFENEMAQIGTICAKNWQKTRATGLNGYDGQCYRNTINFLKEHNYQEVSTNDANYEKAVSAAVTVGGYDFSKYVRPELSCNNSTIKEADEMIKNNITKLELIARYDNVPNDINAEFAVSELIRGQKKVGDKPDIVFQTVKWTEKDAITYKKLLKNIRENYGSYTDEQKKAIEAAIKKLSLDTKKAGSILDETELKTFTRLCNTILECNKNDDNINTNMATAELELRNFYEKKQMESISPVTINAWKDKFETLKKRNSSYREKETLFNPVKVKEWMIQSLNKQEYGKSASQFTVREDYSTQYGTKQTNFAHIMDLSQPFLIEQTYRQRAAETIDRIQKREQKIYQAPNTKDNQLFYLKSNTYSK